eukprot:jgi/Hompol1/1281/HPOL_001158-RA
MPLLNIALIGPGLVGAEFLAQIAAHQKRLAGSASAASPSALRLSVVAIASSRRQLLGDSIDLSTWKERLAAQPVSPQPSLDLTEFIAHASRHAPCVVVDSTSSEAVAAQYASFVHQGLHVVTPNKKAFSGDLSAYSNLLRVAADKQKMVLHESTVGAGLPILSTLNDLVETGDEIEKIEGIFSGTLSYIFNEFSSPSKSSVKFSQVVGVAKELGYTEPDPRDDLNGMDVARKVVILGRLSGLDLSLDTLSVENIVPEAIRSAATAEEFLAKLPEYDDHFARLNQEALAAGSVLRYVGVVDAKGSSVKLVRYPFSHPFASMQGSVNVVAFTTKRFSTPLLIQGFGAGAAVTAFGMFSDILKISRTL